jgi:prepilin-type N-terminal cleavage/methylation domain-containing protein
MSDPHRIHTKSSTGFTLLEVLLASAILCTLLVLLLCLGNGALRMWRDGEHRRESLREARAALQILAEDLHSAVITTNPSSLMIERGTKTNECDASRIFFLVSHHADKRDSKSRGDLCATGYFLAKDPHGVGCRNLYRFHASGDRVAMAAEGDRLGSLYAEATPTNESTTELLSHNIVGLEIIPLTEHSQQPEALEITLSAVNGTTERLLVADPGAKDRNQKLINNHLQRYSVIIHLPPPREGGLVP